MTRSVEPSDLRGSVRAPASKSSLQRALACATLAPGASVIRNATWSADSLAACEVAQALGAKVDRRHDSAIVRGIPASAFTSPGTGISVSCGESGTCLRMFSAVAALFAREIELIGEGSMARRPVGMIVETLRSLGVECSTASGVPPVRVRGPLRGGSVQVDGRSSSQFLTGLLIALPLAREDSRVEAVGLVSRGYVDLTLDVMRAFGVSASRNEGFTEFRIRGGSSYRAAEYSAEGDWSGAAFLLVAGALAARGAPLTVTGLDLESSQPDRAILSALRSAGADLETGEDRVAVRRAPLRAFSFDATDCPDLFPPLAALAAYCKGETLLMGANRLRAKESDRAAALSEEFARIGVRISVDGNLMRVRGLPPDRWTAGTDIRPTSGRIDSRGDHRIAMAAAVAALPASGAVEIEDAECVAKSYPGFFDDLTALGGRVR